MAKVALLIGISEYQEERLNPLPTAVRDVHALQQVLQDNEVGDFDTVRTLLNPDSSTMQYEIEAFFLECSKDDLVVLYFSGHGLKDERGHLYFATTTTHKTPKGVFVRSTAIPARFIREMMNDSRSSRQVLILDCAFSSAFSEGFRAKDSGGVAVKEELAGERSVILASSSLVQYSFESIDSGLSFYTHYLVEGLTTGAADIDSDGRISIDELHNYVRQKLRETNPAQKPEIYAFKEGFSIHLAKAQVGHPRLAYRSAVEKFSSRGTTIPSRQLRYTKEEIARRGKEIYQTQVRAQIGEGYQNKVVAIDIETGAFEIAQDSLTASDQLLEHYPDAQIWFVRVGHRTVHRIGSVGSITLQ